MTTFLARMALTWFAAVIVAPAALLAGACAEPRSYLKAHQRAPLRSNRPISLIS